MPVVKIRAAGEEKLSTTVLADRIMICFGHGAHISVLDSEEDVDIGVVIEQLHLGVRKVLRPGAHEIGQLQFLCLGPLPVVPLICQAKSCSHSFN